MVSDRFGKFESIWTLEQLSCVQGQALVCIAPRYQPLPAEMSCDLSVLVYLILSVLEPPECRRTTSHHSAASHHSATTVPLCSLSPLIAPVCSQRCNLSLNLQLSSDA